MARKRGAGRPRKGSQELSRQQILATALPMIQEGGVEAISFRRLAAKLGVTPMAVKYHVGDQHEMLTALVDLAFRNTLEPVGPTGAAERLRSILISYCDRAIENANLIRCILSDTSLMSEEIVMVTEQIRKCTRALNHGDPQDVLLNLLVDYTHGFVFSAVAAPPEHVLTQEDFLRSIDWVLGQF